MDVIISIKPTWCKKIISGEKTTEVRKTRPCNISTPFRMFIYASFGGENWFRYGKWMSGHVIGEAKCGAILQYNMNEAGTALLSKSSCVDPSDLYKYADGMPWLYGWKINDFELYENPLPLKYFTDSKGNVLKKPPQSWKYANLKWYTD